MCRIVELGRIETRTNESKAFEFEWSEWIIDYVKNSDWNEQYEIPWETDTQG